MAVCWVDVFVTIPCARSVGSWKVTVMVSPVTLFDTRNLTGMILAAMGGGSFGQLSGSCGWPGGSQRTPRWTPLGPLADL